MKSMELFPKDKVVGIFRGFQPGGFEFHAELVLPYRNELQNIPLHGQFVLVQLENPDEAVVGRITSFSSEGKLSSGAGEEFNLRAVREDRDIPEDLREQYLRYRVNIRLLGVIYKKDKKFIFVPSHRRMPHVGSKVAFPSEDVLRELGGHNGKGAPIGHLALGEYVYAGKSYQTSQNDTEKTDRDEGDRKKIQYLKAEPWMRIIKPEVLVKFPIESLVSRRSFIFARAGFGKSNLNKLLFSTLYEKTPTVKKRGGKEVPVGTIIFDPDGEYFWPDDKGRPGLCDVPHLEDKLVVFTERKGPSPFYESFVASGIKLDIRDLRPSDVISIALPPDRQDQQNVRKLRGLSLDKWRELVDLIDNKGNDAELHKITELLSLSQGKQEVEAIAARSNMTTIVRTLHNKNSRFKDMLFEALKEGKLCVIDLSQMRGTQGLILSALILRQIFDRNQREFTKADPQTIPTIAVVEEAQAVLQDKSSASEPYIAWVKEGRKYDLGAVLITQQPGSIPVEILSQGDNWFVFHLLSASDLRTLKGANAHFSDDLLSSLLNEPIPGNGVFWSSVGGRPYPISLRVLSFEAMYPLQDPGYNRPEAETYSKKLREKYPEKSEKGKELTVPESVKQEAIRYLREAIRHLREEGSLIKRIESEEGIGWGELRNFFIEKLFLSPNEEEKQAAYLLVSYVLTELYGDQNTGWETYKKDGKTWIRLKKQRTYRE